MAPISAESKVRWGFVSLETTKVMAGLRCSQQHFRQSPALTGESPHHRRRWVKPSRLITSPTDYYPIEPPLQVMRFTGERWRLFGPIIDGHSEQDSCGDGGTEAPLFHYRW